MGVGAGGRGKAGKKSLFHILFPLFGPWLSATFLTKTNTHRHLHFDEFISHRLFISSCSSLTNVSDASFTLSAATTLLRDVFAINFGWFLKGRSSHVSLSRWSSMFAENRLLWGRMTLETRSTSSTAYCLTDFGVASRETQSTAARAKLCRPPFQYNHRPLFLY